MRIFEGKNRLEQDQATVTSTNSSITPEDQFLQQEYMASDSKVFEEQHKQKEKQFFEKIERQQGHIVKQQQIIKDQEIQLQKLRPLAEEQQAQQSQLMQQNVDLKAQLEKVQEENAKLRTGLDECKKRRTDKNIG